MSGPAHLSVLYRGPLASCNYGCRYCPFAKHAETPEERAADEAALARFVAWAEERPYDLSVLFTPWGEALARRRYRDAVARLSRLPHLRRVAVQTNLSAPPRWLDAADTAKVALWTTYHPTEVTRDRFLARCAELDARGVRYSVGMVGLRTALAEIEAMRAALPPHVYLWVNAYDKAKRDRAAGGPYYSETDLARLRAVDPHFDLSVRPHASRGRACRAGHEAISVDGDGTARPCHFVARPIGNIYAPGFEEALAPRACPRASCDCHIGYVHLSDLGLYDVFAGGVLERIPAGWGSDQEGRTR